MIIIFAERKHIHQKFESRKSLEELLKRQSKP